MKPSPAITITFLAFAFAWGAVWGSFLNVVIWRLPRGMSLSRPSSRCPSCETPIRWRHNVPVIGWFFLRGRCYDCDVPISPRYPGIEFLVGVLSAALWWHVSDGRLDADTLPQVLAVFALQFYLVAALVAVAFIDLDLTIIPHRLSMPLIAWGLLAGLLMPKTGVWVGYFPSVDIVDSAIGAGLGFGLLFVVFGGYRLLRGVDGGGGGDLWLLAAIGANLGWMSIAFVLFAASLQGLTAAAVAMLVDRGRRSRSDEVGGLLIKGAHREEYWRDHPVLGADESADGATPPEGSSVLPQGSAVDTPGAPPEGNSVPPEGGVPAVRGPDGDADSDAQAAGEDDETFMRLAVPFGPFLALAAIEYVFVGRAALEWATSGILP